MMGSQASGTGGRSSRQGRNRAKKSLRAGENCSSTVLVSNFLLGLWVESRGDFVPRDRKREKMWGKSGYQE